MLFLFVGKLSIMFNRPGYLHKANRNNAENGNVEVIIGIPLCSFVWFNPLTTCLVRLYRSLLPQASGNKTSIKASIILTFNCDDFGALWYFFFLKYLFKNINKEVKVVLNEFIRNNFYSFMWAGPNWIFIQDLFRASKMLNGENTDRIHW